MGVSCKSGIYFQKRKREREREREREGERERERGREGGGGGERRTKYTYTCATSRAVHLELVRSLNAESFIRSLTRLKLLREEEELGP